MARSYAATARHRLQADLLREFAQRRRHQLLAAGQDDHRKAVAGTRRGDLAVRAWPRRVQPAERDLVSGEEIAQVVARDVVAVTDDGDARRRRLRGQLLQPGHPLGHRARQFGRQRVARREQQPEVALIELRDARRLERAHARDRRRAQQQRNFSEIVALLVFEDAPLRAMDDLAQFERTLDQQEERRLLAFVDQPVALAQSYVSNARRQRFGLVVRQRREQGDLAQLRGRDHRACNLSPVRRRWTSAARCDCPRCPARLPGIRGDRCCESAPAPSRPPCPPGLRRRECVPRHSCTPECRPCR